jgi:hypothetical protein
LWEGEGERKKLRWGNIVDGLHILIQNRTMKLHAIALSGMGRGSRRRDGESNLTNVNISLFGIVTINIPCTMNIS